MEKVVIRCPKCGYEFAPCEVFYPDKFLGNMQNIIRTPEGKIDLYTGDNMNLEEEFTCDKCNCTFTVKARIGFSTSVSKHHDFSTPYKTKIKK